MKSFLALLLLAGLATPAFPQLPPPGVLSPADQQALHAEIARLQGLLPMAADQPAITYSIARTWAYGQQWTEAIDWLRKAVDFKAGIDPSRDSIFAPLHGTRELDAIIAEAVAATPPVAHSRLAFTVAEGDLVPESIAYDPASRSFYLGSMKKNKVVRCSATGQCRDFAVGLGIVQGLKVAGGGLWVLNNTPERAELIYCELASGRVLARYAATGPGHEFNDLTISNSGDIYLTDTPAGLVWHFAPGAKALTQLPGHFTFANGITLSPDGSLLYVSTFPDGITVVDVRSGAAAALLRPSAWCLVDIDGLYFDQGTLIAIQNGIMNPRVIRIKLKPDLHSAVRLEVRERRNRLFDGITTGVMVDRDFFYMANNQDGKPKQDGKPGGFNPISILKTHL